MNDSKYKYILYFIVVVILATVGIQAFWNYKNYRSNKQQLINDVQASLDQAVDDYYTSLAQKTTLGLKLEGNAQKDVFDEGGFMEQISKSIDESHSKFNHLDSIDFTAVEGVTILRGSEADSMMQADKKEEKPLSTEAFKKKIKDLRKNDSVRIDISNFEMLTSKVFISISNDSLDLKQIDSLLTQKLSQKNIELDYRLAYKATETDTSVIQLARHTAHDSLISPDQLFLKATSKSTLLPENSSLTIQYENVTWAVLKRIIGAIIISTLLVLAVIGCLFYLLKIIKHQKQLAEVKNDLISNITHEFKTPIATIGVALESIQNFNAIEDKEKTKTYLKMSSEQLDKLNTMVEKLLETATLDSENLELKTDEYDLSEVINSIVERHRIRNTGKTIRTAIEPEVFGVVDIFHFENAINNVVDNAIKYGGQDISVDLQRRNSHIEISISDNGQSLTKANKDRIFEKFYRIPKGNTHDVKGFGIGLYYTKKIVEKHHGTISLEFKNKRTNFKILLPNV